MLSVTEVVYLEELPPNGGERFGRHRCPTPGCRRDARYGTVTCGYCWARVPAAKRRLVIAGFRQREADPDLWADACHVMLALATDYSSQECQRRAASSTDRAPESDPAEHRRTA